MPLVWVEVRCFAMTIYMPTCLHIDKRACLHAYTLACVHAYMHLRTCLHAYTQFQTMPYKLPQPPSPPTSTSVTRTVKLQC